MSLPSLTELVRRREERGELLRITEPVAPHLELAEFVRQCAAADAERMIVFEQVTGSRYAVVANAWSSRQDVSEGLAAESLDRVWERLDPPLDAESLGIEERPNPGWNLLRSLRGSIGKTVPATRNSPSQQIVHLGRDVNLETFPIPRFDAMESGSTLTAAQVVTVHPLSGLQTLSHATLEFVSGNSFAVHWLPHDSAWDALAAARVSQRQLPVAVILGSTAPWLVAAEASYVTGVDPWKVAQRVSPVPLEISRARTIELSVPTEAEFIIEGVINPDCDFHSGRISTPLATLAPVGPSPVMDCTAITHRANPLFPVTMPEPCGEQHLRLQLRSAFTTRALQASQPDILEASFPESGGGVVAFLRVQKKYAHQGRQLLHAAWGIQPTANAKLIVVVDGDVPLIPERQVWTTIARQLDPARDLVQTSGPALGWDVTSLVDQPGGKLGIDATRKLPGEIEADGIRDLSSTDNELRKRVRQRLEVWGVIV